MTGKWVTIGFETFEKPTTLSIPLFRK